jgi:hypothetical protein
VYRLVLGVFCLYSCIINNWLYLPEFLDIYIIHYIGELSPDFNQVKMFSGSGGSSGGHYGFFPSDYGSSFGGGGPSGSGGSGPPVGSQSLTDQNEDSNKSKGKKRVH